MSPHSLRLRVAAGGLASFVILAAGPRAGAASLPPGFAETRIVSGLSGPTAMAFAPDGRLFICEQRGTLRVVKDGALLPTPFVTLPVDSAGERGLLGIAFDPDFRSNQFIYLYYTARSPTVHNRVSRFTASGDVAVAGSERVILELNPLSSATNHNGGALHFGRDGKLYIAAGENAQGAHSQSLGNLLGKILRINKDGSIPADNPFFDTASGVNRAIWAIGLRNPFTFAFQPGTGRMHINDVGQGTWEEINLGIAGANYGWPETEGPTGDARFRAPIHAYRHDPGTGVCAITGGVFYDPPTPQFPADYVGTYFFADFCAGWIRRLDFDTGAVSDFASGINNPVDLRVTRDGSLYYLARSPGAVFRVRFTGVQAPRITTHPESVTVPVGDPASFTVSANGGAPLSYQWQRNGVDIAGATGSTHRIDSAPPSFDGSRFRVRVSNPFGTVTSQAATLTVTSNTAPTAVISAPVHGAPYRAGDTIRFSGTGTDREDGALPTSAFTWRVDFHHGSHLHPFLLPTSGIRSGEITIPVEGETSTNVFYRMVLTVRDRGGLTSDTFVDLVPRTSILRIATSPPGLRVALDGQRRRAPFSFESVEGMTRRLGVVTPQRAGAVAYDFLSWSDRGAASHEIRAPAADTTFTARFQARPPVGTGLVATYFDQRNLAGRSVTRIDPTVGFLWGLEAPAPGIAADTFSVRWTGRVLARVSGVHRFYVRSDDGARLWVNGQLVLDDWTRGGSGEASGTIPLTAGVKYDVRLEYFDESGPALAQLFWHADGLQKQIVPQSQLFPYALLVVPEVPLVGPDVAVKTRLEETGYVPRVVTALAATEADAAGKALVVIPSTVDALDLGTKFRHTRVPILTWDLGAYLRLRMTGASAGVHFGAAEEQTRLRIATPGHPVAAGLSGTVVVRAAPSTFHWGAPTNQAVIIAALDATPSRPAIFAYPAGASMFGVRAPARRVGFFFQNPSVESLNPSGWALFDAAVRWASGR